MKTLQIVSKRKADSILVESLFNKGGTLNPMKLDGGKYQWTGKASDYEGREVEVSDSVHAVWVERRQDREGPYALVMCLVDY